MSSFSKDKVAGAIINRLWAASIVEKDLPDIIISTGDSY